MQNGWAKVRTERQSKVSIRVRMPKESLADSPKQIALVVKTKLNGEQEAVS